MEQTSPGSASDPGRLFRTRLCSGCARVNHCATFSGRVRSNADHDLADSFGVFGQQRVDRFAQRPGLVDSSDDDPNLASKIGCAARTDSNPTTTPTDAPDHGAPAVCYRLRRAAEIRSRREKIASIPRAARASTRPPGPAPPTPGACGCPTATKPQVATPAGQNRDDIAVRWRSGPRNNASKMA